jgi:hypothetical protein
MHLTLATSALLALPSTASHNKFLLTQNHEVNTKRANHVGQRRALTGMLHRGVKHRGNPQAASMPRPGITSLFENTGVLKNKNINKNFRTLEAGDECDPNDSPIDLDTGILQCGSIGLICTPNDSSTMGGTCDGDGQDDGLDALFLALVCTVANEYCDCKEFDSTAGTGKIECYYCIAPEDIKASYRLTLVVEENDIIASSVCGYIHEPYKQSYCYNTEYDQQDRAASKCEITVGQDTCTSCDYDILCTTFDCTNTVGNAIAGDFCDDHPLPIIGEIEKIVTDPNFDPEDAVCGAAGLIGRLLAASTFATMVVGYLIA